MNDHVHERDGRFWIRGTHMLLDPVIKEFLQGALVEEIAQKHSPELTLARAYGAIAYYLDHSLQIDEYLKRNE